RGGERGTGFQPVVGERSEAARSANVLAFTHHSSRGRLLAERHLATGFGRPGTDHRATPARQKDAPLALAILYKCAIIRPLIYTPNSDAYSHPPNPCAVPSPKIPHPSPLRVATSAPRHPTPFLLRYPPANRFKSTTHPRPFYSEISPPSHRTRTG